MLGRFVKTIVIVGLATVVIQGLPDIARYLRLRNM